MGRSAGQYVLLTFACAFSSCWAEVTQGVKMSPQTTSFHYTATSAQPPSLYHSSSHRGTTFHFNSTSSLITTPISHRTTVQTTGQSLVTAPTPHTTAQAAATTTQATSHTALTVLTTTAAETTVATGHSTTSARETGTPAVKNTTIHFTSPTSQTTRTVSVATTRAATNTTGKPTLPKNQTTTTAITTTATTKTTVKPTTRSANQTTTTKTPTTTAMTNITVHPGNQTTIPSTTTMVRPTLSPQPSPTPTGTYTVRNGSMTCIKAAMGLQLMAQNTKKKQMEYMNINPNMTQTSGSCGMLQSALNITFNGGFINFVFVKRARLYYVSTIETSLQLSSEGMLYYTAIHEQLFTTKLGNSFKCISKQVFGLQKNFQLLIVNMQLQAFDIVGNQFGKEEECFLDRNSKAVPIAVGLSILGLFVIVLITFVISRRKPHRGYERI